MFIVWLVNLLLKSNLPYEHRAFSEFKDFFLLKNKSIIKILLIILRINGSVTFDHQVATTEVHHEHILNYFWLIMPISIKVAIVLSILMVEGRREAQTHGTNWTFNSWNKDSRWERQVKCAIVLPMPPVSISL